MKALVFTLTLFATGCAVTNPQFVDYSAEECERAGVSTDQNRPLVPVVRVTSTTVGSVHKHCHSALSGLVTVYGCIKPTEGGWEIYHSGGTSKVHEWCHAKYGPRHTPYSFLGM